MKNTPTHTPLERKQWHELTHLKHALRTLIDRADDLEAAVSGATDQFEDELSRLSAAATASEKTLEKAQP